MLASNLCLDLIDLADAFQQISGERRRLGGVDVEYLSPEMRPASNLGDAVRVVELVITGIAVGLEIAGEVGQLPLGMRAGAIGGELIPDQRRGRGTGATIIDGVSPEPASRRLLRFTARTIGGRDRGALGSTGRRRHNSTAHRSIGLVAALRYADRSL